MIIDGIQITTVGFDFDNPHPDHDELKNYVAFVRERVPNASTVQVKNCGDGFVDVTYTVRHEKFERIRRITGKEIAVRRQAV